MVPRDAYIDETEAIGAAVNKSLDQDHQLLDKVESGERTILRY